MGPELSVWGFLVLAVLKILTVLTERGNALLHKSYPAFPSESR